MYVKHGETIFKRPKLKNTEKDKRQSIFSKIKNRTWWSLEKAPDTKMEKENAFIFSGNTSNAWIDSLFHGYSIYMLAHGQSLLTLEKSL